MLNLIISYLFGRNIWIAKSLLELFVKKDLLISRVTTEVFK